MVFLFLFLGHGLNIDTFILLGKNILKGIEKEAAGWMYARMTDSGWMNRDLFVEWLQRLDDDATQPTLLLLDSTGAHNNIDMREPGNNICNDIM